jgi:hypothetical protein
MSEETENLKDIITKVKITLSKPSDASDSDKNSINFKAHSNWSKNLKTLNLVMPQPRISSIWTKRKYSYMDKDDRSSSGNAGLYVSSEAIQNG